MRPRHARPAALILLLLPALAGCLDGLGPGAGSVEDVEAIEVRVAGETREVAPGTPEFADLAKRAIRTLRGVENVHREAIDYDQFPDRLNGTEWVHVRLRAGHGVDPVYEHPIEMDHAYLFVSERPGNGGGDAFLCNGPHCGVYSSRTPFGKLPGATDVGAPM